MTAAHKSEYITQTPHEQMVIQNATRYRVTQRKTRTKPASKTFKSWPEARSFLMSLDGIEYACLAYAEAEVSGLFHGALIAANDRKGNWKFAEGFA